MCVEVTAVASGPKHRPGGRRKGGRGGGGVEGTRGGSVNRIASMGEKRILAGR